MNTLELLDKIAPGNVKKSRVECVKDMYLNYCFTVIQKRGIELFIFEPTKEQAFKAMEITPKAWLFIRHVVSEDEIVAVLSDWIEHGKVNRTYIRTIVTNNGLKDLLEILMQSPCKSQIEKYIKRRTMELKLKK